MRILIGGGPNCGKSTLTKHDTPHPHIWHTDIIIQHYEWSDQAIVVLDWLNQPGPWIIEGVTVQRALKYWFALELKGKPCDLIYWCVVPKTVYTKPGQHAMLTRAKFMWPFLRPQLEERGVEIVEVP